MEVMGLQEGNSPAGALITKEATFFKSYWKHCKDNVMNKLHKGEIIWMGSLKLSMEQTLDTGKCK